MLGHVAARDDLLFVDSCGMWSTSPYNFCSFRCSYCSMEAQGKSRPKLSAADFEAAVRQKIGTLRPGEVVGIGTTADAYPPIEAEHGLTRRLITLLTEAKVRFGIVTKGTLVLRDIDLLAGNPHCTGVMVSVSTHDAESVRRFEPGAPSYEERRELVYRLKRLGAPVSVSAAPFIPGITDPQRIVDDFRPHVMVTFGALDLVLHTQAIRPHFGLPVVPSAARTFPNTTQDEINREYLFAAQQHMSHCVRFQWPPRTSPNGQPFLMLNRRKIEELLAEQSEPEKCAV